MVYEEFRAVPKQVAGVAVLFEDIADDALASADYLRSECSVQQGLGAGVLALLSDPLAATADFMSTRYADLSDVTRTTGVELNRTAWMYADQDARTYDALNANILFEELIDAHYDSYTPAPGPAAPFIDPETYRKAEEVDLSLPEVGAEDIRQVIADAAGWLGDVDDAIHAATGWSPLLQFVEPLTGNWNELKRIGDAYRIAAEGMETCGSNVRAGYEQLDPHWDGAAAQCFTEHAERQAAAMEWEGPVGRVAKEMCFFTSDKVRDAAISGVRRLATMLEAEVSLENTTQALKFAVKKIPWIGTYIQVNAIVEIIEQAASQIDDLVNSVQKMVEALEGFLAAMASPSGYLNEKFEEKLAPITDAYTDTKTKAELAMDIASVADAGDTYNAPKSGYVIGDDPWADAV
ncbi:Uncharacterised protein [Rhodococcus rhodochrous]|uniref:hypothetical protein n=1 Tax=Rhodococcus rhodochrous TaxID=1829 RepID=UPI0007CD79AD|nr:hypothetical protein [Rhodococcus rhodochrous]SNV16174.1 Uncharacterised protein [Rhodococcus rhodochrous]